MNLVETQGREFADRSVSAGETVYADGSDETVPYFWAMGDKFAVRVDFGGSCPSRFCMETAPVASVRMFERTLNGSGSELVEVAEMAGHVPGGESARVVAAETMGQAAASVPAEVVEMFERIAPEQVVHIVWARDLAGELATMTVADEVASYMADK